MAARDNDALEATRAIKETLLGQLHAARNIADPVQSTTLRNDIEEYYAAAHDVSRRIISGETGEAMVIDPDTGAFDWVRGRVSAVNNIFISSSNQLGAVESGLTASWFGPVGSVAGGIAVTILVVAAFALRAKRLREWRQ